MQKGQKYINKQQTLHRFNLIAERQRYKTLSSLLKTVLRSKKKALQILAHIGKFFLLCTARIRIIYKEIDPIFLISFTFYKNPLKKNKKNVQNAES
ncbi:hypothetical protein GCM10022423_01090 [Flavobacterium ginsengiterrae]|uniref:Uncharacterized protein n=1 Tax=Flavobacterium ginsengiterrae TaxID=871695 RepID=A0ABP7G4P2_9FLAO